MVLHFVAGTDGNKKLKELRTTMQLNAKRLAVE